MRNEGAAPVPRSAAGAAVRTLAYLLAGIALAPLTFGLLLSGWLAAGLLAVTPLSVPVLVVFRWSVRRLALCEAALARTLLGADLEVPASGGRGRGFWAAGGSVLADGGFWRQQTFLLVRMVGGPAAAVAELSILAAGGGLVALPLYYRHSNTDFGFTKIDTIGKALACVPVGLVVLVLGVVLLRPLAACSRSLAVALLGGPPATSRRLRRRALAAHAALFALLNGLLIVIWAVTPHGTFWPQWTLITLAPLLLVHGFVELVEERPRLWRHGPFGKAFAIHTGVTLAVALLLLLVWAVTAAGYVWPAWPIGALLLLLAAHALALGLGGGRIEQLERTRAGAVEAQESELRRIERDLHDGAQARLVAVGMTIGLAEQRLDDDPTAARQLLAEARAGMGAALHELRDLARGIHPPILADRGLGDAIAALAERSPLRVDVDVALPARPAPAVETAAYFVAAEAIANAAKHARASTVRVTASRRGDVLSVEIADDGRGGADPAGRGLRGLRQRVEALDGTFSVDSPAGGPTTVRAELPCAS